MIKNLVGSILITVTLAFSNLFANVEYDIQDIGIECFLGANNKLNYIIHLENKNIGIIQSPDVLDLDEVGEVNFRLYQDDKIANKIDQLELE